MRTILVTFDGSDNARRALAFAIERGKEVPDSMLHVLIVHPEPRVAGRTAIYPGKQRMHQLAADHAASVSNMARELLSGSRVRYVTEQVEGKPATQIVRRARELGCESIIMGHPGARRIRALFASSVATRVLHRSSLPVTFVK